MAVTFMVFGGILFLIGLFSFQSSTTNAQNVQIVKTIDRSSLDHAIEMAEADGHISNNEKKLIRKKAEALGLNADEELRIVVERNQNSNTVPETETIDVHKRNGDEFEGYIVNRFDKRYFNLKEWAGDKYANGTYADTTLNPDLLLELKLDGTKHPLSVECKWRKSFQNDNIKVATAQQIKRYKAFQKKHNTPVFMAIGIGGDGAHPQEVFMVPIDKINSEQMQRADLAYYRKRNGKKFYFDTNEKTLN